MSASFSSHSDSCFSSSCFRASLFFSVAVLLLWYPPLLASNEVPVIGILTVPCLPQIAAHDCPSWIGFSGSEYFSASYVKFLESGGAKVVPIYVTDPLETVAALLPQLNGVLFTGGTETFNDQSVYYNQVRNILGVLRKFHAQPGSEFQSIPLWATCLGFQAMVCATSQTGPSILQGNYDASHVPLQINFAAGANESRLFDSTMPAPYATEVFLKFGTEAVSLNDHSGGFNPSAFAKDDYLTGNFSLLGNSNDERGKPFVTMVESLSALGLGWYGVQFHPEKPQYEFIGNGVHNLDSVFANQYLASFFVNECRVRNNNSMSTAHLDSMVIYNFEAYYVDKYGGSSFEQNYVFNRD